MNMWAKVVSHALGAPRLAAGALLILTAAGCSGPKGDPGGRVEVHETTEAERESGQMAGGDLASASDRVAQEFAADINRLAEEDWGNYRVTLILGDIKNKSGGMPTSDFEYVQTRVKNRLMKSRLFRDNVKVVERRKRMESLNKEELGGDGDLLQEGDDPAAVSARNPEHTYYLLGDAYGIHRGSTHLYYLTFKLNRAKDGEEVFSQDYEVKYGKKKD